MVANEPYQKHVTQAANNEEVQYVLLDFKSIVYTFMLLLHLSKVNMSKPLGC
jgi:hypothetical protein